MARPVGIRVFPSRSSERIRNCPALLHYRPSLPQNEPPIDYFDNNTDFPNRQPHHPNIQPHITKTVLEQYYQPPSSHQSNSKPEHRSHSETGSSLSSSQSADFGSYSEKTFLDRQLNGHSTSSTEIAYLPSSITSPVGYEKYKRLGPDGEESEFTDDKTGMEILQELDSALEEDEQMSLEDIRKGAKDTDLSFRQYATQTYDLLIPEPAIDYDHQTRHNHRFLINCDSDSEEQGSSSYVKPFEVYMDGETSHERAVHKLAPKLNQAVISELKMMSNGITSLAQYKEEKRKEISERKDQVYLEIEAVNKEYTAEKFIDQTPEYFSGTDTEIPRWKRLLMAQKIAKEAIKKREDELWDEFAKWKEQVSPSFRLPPK